MVEQYIGINIISADGGLLKKQKQICISHAYKIEEILLGFMFLDGKEVGHVIMMLRLFF